MFDLRPHAIDRKLLPDARLSGPAPWVIAIMMFLMILAAAGGKAIRTALHDGAIRRREVAHG